MKLHFIRLREGGDTGNQGLLLGSLVSLIQEFKRRIKRKHKDSFIRVFKAKPKTQGQRSCKSQQLLEREWGERKTVKPCH